MNREAQQKLALRRIRPESLMSGILEWVRVGLLTSTQAQVYQQIVVEVPWRTGRKRLAHGWLAGKLGLAYVTTKRAIHRLTELGLVRVDYFKPRHKVWGGRKGAWSGGNFLEIVDDSRVTLDEKRKLVHGGVCGDPPVGVCGDPPGGVCGDPPIPLTSGILKTKSKPPPPSRAGSRARAKPRSEQAVSAARTGLAQRFAEAWSTPEARRAIARAASRATVAEPREREAVEGGGSTAGRPDAPLVATVEDARRWWHFRARYLVPGEPCFEPSRAELAPILAALTTERLCTLLWVVVASRQANKIHSDRRTLWTVDVLLRPATIRRMLHFARGRGWNVESEPPDLPEPPRRQARPEATSTLPSEGSADLRAATAVTSTDTELLTRIHEAAAALSRRGVPVRKVAP